MSTALPPGRYDLESYDRDGRPLGAIEIGAAPRGASCANGIKLAMTGDGYTIVKVTTRRPQFGEATLVHRARDPARARCA